MKKPIGVYSMGLFGIEVLAIDDYDDSIKWKWSNENVERESSIQYNIEGEAFFMAGTENEILLSECLRV